jgi:transposase-like protein
MRVTASAKKTQPRNTSEEEKRSASMTETRYTRDFADEVCRRLAEGNSLREVCRDHGIAESSVRQWVRDNRDDFAMRYQTARVLQVEAWSDLIIEIGNRDDLDPQEKRVRIDSLKWLMSRIVPKKWGDRLLVAGDPESPLQVMHSQVSLSELTDPQLDALQRFTQSLLIDVTQD